MLLRDWRVRKTTSWSWYQRTSQRTSQRMSQRWHQRADSRERASYGTQEGTQEGMWEGTPELPITDGYARDRKDHLDTTGCARSSQPWYQRTSQDWHQLALKRARQLHKDYVRLLLKWRSCEPLELHDVDVPARGVHLEEAAAQLRALDPGQVDLAKQLLGPTVKDKDARVVPASRRRDLLWGR